MRNRARPVSILSMASLVARWWSGCAGGHVVHGAVPACPPSKTCWGACHTVEVSGWEESMADVDLRKLRYFVAVAEQLPFGRAAEALHIAQPVLSRQIRALEEELEAQLFVRDKRATELTPAGRQLLDDAGPVLAGKDTISVADLADEHLLQDPGAVPEWRDIATEMRTRRRHCEPAFRTVEEK